MHQRVFLLTAISIFFLGVLNSSAEAEISYIIPEWVKDITGLWVEGKITDNNFLEIITFLIDEEIVTIPLIQDLQNEITQLKNENEILRAELDNSNSLVKAESSALPPIGISIQTDKSSYIKGEYVTVTGIITNNMQGVAILFSMYDPNDNLLAVHEISPNDEGYFLIDTSTKNPLWDTTGMYYAIVSHGPNTDKITFYFDAEEILENQSS